MALSESIRTVRMLRQRLETLAIDEFSSVTVTYKDNGEETYNHNGVKFAFNKQVRVCVMTKAGTELFTYNEREIDKVVARLEESAKEKPYLGI